MGLPENGAGSALLVCVTSVFKFTKRSHAEDAVLHGRFRFNHVSSFRVSEGVEDGRSDADEMVTRANVLDGEETVLSTDPHFDGMFVQRRAGKVVPMEMTLSGAEVQFIDSGMLFCASLDNSDDMFEMMKSKFNAEAAYEIVDVQEFARRIESHILDTGDHLHDFISPHRPTNSSIGADFAEALRRHEQWERDRRAASFKVDSRPVTYVDRIVAPSVAEVAHDPFQKPASYAWQREYRILITAFEGRDHYEIQMPSLSELVRVVR